MLFFSITYIDYFPQKIIAGPYLPDNNCSDILLLALPGAGEAIATWLLATTACCAACRAAAEGRAVKGSADEAANENSLK